MEDSMALQELQDHLDIREQQELVELALLELAVHQDMPEQQELVD
jgi:hypothetical protein